MRIFKRITALALAAVTAGAMGLGAAAEVEQNAAESTEIEVYCPVNEDPEFPFNIELDFDQNSIQYVDFDEPVYGFESILDGEALDFSLNVSLKDEFKDFESFNFELFKADYSEKLFYGNAEGDEVLSVPDMSIAKGYKLSAALVSDSLSAYYGGQFTIQVELDSTVVVDLFYQFAGMEGDAAPYSNDMYEDEPENNNPLLPDTLITSRKMNAEIGGGDKVDYFRYFCTYITTEDDGEEINYSGMVNLSFTLTVPKDANMSIEFRNEDGSLVRDAIPIVTKTSGSTYYFKINNAIRATTYLIKISSDSSSKIPYSLTANYEFTLAWFGQYNSKDVDGVYWNANKLDEIYNNQYPIFWKAREVLKITYFQPVAVLLRRL